MTAWLRHRWLLWPSCCRRDAQFRNVTVFVILLDTYESKAFFDTGDAGSTAASKHVQYDSAWGTKEPHEIAHQTRGLDGRMGILIHVRSLVRNFHAGRTHAPGVQRTDKLAPTGRTPVII